MEHKTLKFNPELIPLVLSGSKTATWRLWDDKNLAVGDIVDFLDSRTKEKFFTARLTKISEKPFRDLTENDKTGHESYASDNSMLDSFSSAYNRQVTFDTIVKIIWFKPA